MPCRRHPDLKDCLAPEAFQAVGQAIREIRQPYRIKRFLAWLVSEQGHVLDLARIGTIGQAEVERYFVAIGARKPGQKYPLITDLKNLALHLYQTAGVAAPRLGSLKHPRRVFRTKNVLSVEDVQKLISWPPAPHRKTDKRDTTIFALLYFGAKPGELLQARRSDYVKEPEAVIHLPVGRDPQTRRTLPLVPLLVDLLEEYLRDWSHLPANALLFPSLRGTQVCRSYLIGELARRSAALGLGFQVGLRDLREACKAHMRDQGVPRVVLQALLGLKSPDETDLIGRQLRMTRRRA